MQPDFEQARSLFLEGVAHFEAGRLHEAEGCFQASLARLPGRASTRINLGATRLRLGRPAEALAELNAVLAAEPQHLDAWGHRAAALVALGRDGEALVSAAHVLERNPEDGAAWHWRGVALERLRRFDEALPAFERLVALQPARAEGWLHLGQLQQRQGRLPEALISLGRALALAPADAAVCSQRGWVLKDLGRIDEAAAAFERAIALGADAELLRFVLAAMGRAPGPDAPPRGYVRALFDDYADGFDEHLVEQLGYQAHRRLVEPLARWQPAGFASALDLGCGTGLCGTLLRPLARRLQGVDLSQPMLDRAASLGVYDRLDCAELVEHLARSDERHDLVVAADVFIYVGELRPVFEGVMRVLRPGGVFCFSVEQAQDGRPVALNAQLRYAHSLPYLLELARCQGLRLLRHDVESIRQDRTQAIPGLYVYLGR